VFKEYLLQAEQVGRSQVPVDSEVVRVAIRDSVLAHVDSYRLTFLTTTGIALLGALICFLLALTERKILFEVSADSSLRRTGSGRIGAGYYPHFCFPRRSSASPRPVATAA
jgi:hypothetical protein